MAGRQRKNSALGIVAALLSATVAARAGAQSFTWTGDFFGVWNQSLNWSPNGIPNSPTAGVNFTGNNVGSVNIFSSVQTQSLTFSNPTGAYTLTSSAGASLSGVTSINLAAGVTGIQTINLANIAAGSLLFPVNNSLSITNNSIAAGTTLTIGPNTVIGTPGSGGVYVDGAGATQISGSFAASGTGNYVLGGLHKLGSGTLLLSNPANSYFGGTFVNAGTLSVGNGVTLPTGQPVVVSSGQLEFSSLASNTPATAIGRLSLIGTGKFLVPSGSLNYHLNYLDMTGGTIDLTGATSAVLHLRGDTFPTPNTYFASSTTAKWIGPATSSIQNDSGSPINFFVHAGTTPSGIDLDASISLSSAGTNVNFVKSGAGTMRLTSLNNSATIVVSQGVLRVDDMATGGVGALGSGSLRNFATLQYGGPSATTTKSLIMEGNPVIQVLTPGVNLIYNGVISAPPLTSLHVRGPGAGSLSSTLTLGGVNSYDGLTSIDGNAILAIPNITNIGQASPIGPAGNAGISLGATSSRGALLLTGANSVYSTDRPFQVTGLYGNQGGGAIGVANETTKLTIPTRITGAGSLIKIGDGTLTLTNTTNSYTGGTYVEGGTLLIETSGAVIPANSDVTVSSGANVTLNGATVTGGFLRGPGAFNLAGGTALAGVTTFTSATINQTGPASVANFTNGGSFTVGGGQTLAWNGGANTSSGRMIVNGTANVRDFVSNGVVAINPGGALNHAGAPLVMGGGSRTFVGSAAVPGGAINLGGQTLDLNGGLLVNNGTIGGTVNVNYGSLAAGTGAYGVVNVNQGGVFSPGNSAGTVTVDALNMAGAGAVSAPVLAMELAGTQQGSQYDFVDVTGALSLGGTLEVSLVDGYVPHGSQSFDILDWGSLIGTFSQVVLPTLGGTLLWNTSQLYTTGVLSVTGPTLDADFDENGAVNGADLARWRMGFGTGTTHMQGNADGDGDVDGGDFLVWQRQLGIVHQVPAAAGVPEPSAWALMALAVGWLARRRL